MCMLLVAADQLNFFLRVFTTLNHTNFECALFSSFYIQKDTYTFYNFRFSAKYNGSKLKMTTKKYEISKFLCEFLLLLIFFFAFRLFGLAFFVLACVAYSLIAKHTMNCIHTEITHTENPFSFTVFSTYFLFFFLFFFWFWL